MAPVDLNEQPEEDAYPREETGAETYLREKNERIADLKRKRKEEELLTPSKKNASSQASASSSAEKLKSEYEKARKGSLRLPEGWLDCPSFGEPIGDLNAKKFIGSFIPSKAPLGENFKDVIPPEKRYTPASLVRIQKQKNRMIGLVVDLTNTNRYYREEDWKKLSIHYLKIPCRGRDEVPDNATVNLFCYEVKRFYDDPAHKKKHIVVHCTHGHNRTGYMLINYLIRTEAVMSGYIPSVVKKLQQFSTCRFPGIYKEEYIQSLFTNYHELRPSSALCPSVPEWKNELDLNGEVDADGIIPLAEDEEDGAPVPSPDHTLGVVPSEEKLTNDDVLGDAIPDELQLDLQKIVCSLLNVQTNARVLHFPGSQPVSLDRKNIQLLRQRIYYATWKADGMRYMMLLMADGVYLIDRNFRFRRVQARFPIRVHNSGTSKKNEAAPMHHYTLLDGEMVIDLVKDSSDPPKNNEVRRYLVYDVMALLGQSLVKLPFSERWARIQSDIVAPRSKDRDLKLHGYPYSYDAELFKVRQKGFWPLNTTYKLLHKVIPQLCHESDGLIFQGWNDPYVPRTHEGLLKWKYAHMNSVDFQLELTAEGKPILLLVDRGRDVQLEGAKVTFPEGLDPADLQKKVIECSCVDSENKEWEFMRIRHDKERANAKNTYTKVVGSINDKITEEILLQEIESICKLPMYTDRESRKKNP